MPCRSYDLGKAPLSVDAVRRAQVYGVPTRWLSWEATRAALADAGRPFAGLFRYIGRRRAAGGRAGRGPGPSTFPRVPSGTLKLTFWVQTDQFTVSWT